MKNNEKTMNFGSTLLFQTLSLFFWGVGTVRFVEKKHPKVQGLDLSNIPQCMPLGKMPGDTGTGWLKR